MNDLAPELRIVTCAEVEANTLYDAWDDPKQIARPNAEKRAAILTNPFARPEDPAQIIGLVGTRVAGRMDVLPGQLSVNGQPERIFYGSALYVEEDARHTGIGLMILLKIQALNHTIGVCGISQVIYPIYQKLRWTDFKMLRLVFVRKSRAVLETMIRPPLVARVASIFVDQGLILVRVALSVVLNRRMRGLTTEVLTSMPPYLDPVIARSADVIGPVRSAAWFNWLLANRFLNVPSLKRRLTLVKDASGNVVGYFLTKSRFYETVTQRQLKNIILGSLQDWQVLDPKAIDTQTIVLLAVKSLGEDNVDAIEVGMPDETVAQGLKRFGFLRVGLLNLLLRTGPKSPVMKKEFHDPTRWVIRPADGDNFFG